MEWHLCGWTERIPGGTRKNDGLETGLGGAYGREISVVTAARRPGQHVRVGAAGLAGQSPWHCIVYQHTHTRRSIQKVCTMSSTALSIALF